MQLAKVADGTIPSTLATLSKPQRARTARQHSLRQRLAICEQRVVVHDYELEMLISSLDAPYYKKLLIRHVLVQVMQDSSFRKHSFKSPEKRTRVILAQVHAQFDTMSFDKMLLNWGDTQNCTSARASRRERAATQQRLRAEKDIEHKWAKDQPIKLQTERILFFDPPAPSSYCSKCDVLPSQSVPNDVPAQKQEIELVSEKIDPLNYENTDNTAESISTPAGMSIISASFALPQDVINATRKREQMERRLSRLFGFDDDDDDNCITVTTVGMENEICSTGEQHTAGMPFPDVLSPQPSIYAHDI